jgi:predicted peptidase
VWRWASAHPDDLAGIAPVCGYGDPALVCRARQVPVRAYHGDADTVVPLAAQQACVDALRACGGEVTFTIYPGVGHGAWVPAYEDAGLVPWLMARVRP